MLIAASNFRNKEDLLKMLKDRQEAQAQHQQVVQKMTMDKAQADTTATQAKAAADFALAAERKHASVHHIAATHEMHNEMMAPPDAPSEPGTVVLPEIQAALADADIRRASREGDGRGAGRGFEAIGGRTRVNNILIARHNALAPPEPPGGAA